MNIYEEKRIVEELISSMIEYEIATEKEINLVLEIMENEIETIDILERIIFVRTDCTSYEDWLERVEKWEREDILPIEE